MKDLREPCRARRRAVIEELQKKFPLVASEAGEEDAPNEGSSSSRSNKRKAEE